MDSTVLVALISFAGTALGTAAGIVGAGKLTEFRLKSLENKLDAQSRTVAKIPVMEERIHSITRRISILERENPDFRC